MSGGLTPRDLEAEEVNVTSAVLMGAAHHYGKYCERLNEAFMECRTDSKDPRKCLAEGREVTRCALEFFRVVKSSCNDVFTAHWTCLDERNQSYKACRKTQKAFEACMEKRQDGSPDSAAA
jgi:NADH dehydrogenase (ubiquinone) 1 alpha subcomplex subunit 8